MMNYFSVGGVNSFIFAPLMVVFLAWSLAWKGVALWKAAERRDLYWFIALLVINTLGILEILYIYIWSKRPHHHTAV